jgi:uncharacterized protein YycO
MTTPVPEVLPAPAPRPGDILLFSRPHRSRDFLIQWFTRSPFYHSAIYAGDDSVIESRPQGVIRNGLQGREGGYRVIPAPGGKGAEALVWAETQLGAGYDRFDMLVIVLEHVFTHWHLNYVPHGKYTCGEFVATVYQSVGVTLAPGRDLDDVVPADFAHLLPAA